MFSLGFHLKEDIFRDLNSKLDLHTSPSPPPPPHDTFWQRYVRSLQQPPLQRSGKLGVYQIRLNFLLLRRQEFLCSNYGEVASLWAA